MKQDHNIILASASAARKMMLENVGISFRSIPADIDECAIIHKYSNKNTDISAITAKLAEEKARHIALSYPDDLVIGSDQTLELNGVLLSKSKDKAEAEIKLKSLRGATHILRSCVCVIQGNNIVFSYTSQANLTMHDFDDIFLQKYMEKNPDALISCVGGYKIEGAGAWLFSAITGDVFTIMGMPLLPLLSFLREEYKIYP